MDNIGKGHWVFAAIFLVVFIGAMIYAYRKDLAKVRVHYRHVWVVLVIILLIYFAILYLNKLT